MVEGAGGSMFEVDTAFMGFSYAYFVGNGSSKLVKFTGFALLNS